MSLLANSSVHPSLSFPTARESRTLGTSPGSQGPSAPPNWRSQPEGGSPRTADDPIANKGNRWVGGWESSLHWAMEAPAEHPQGRQRCFPNGSLCLLLSQLRPRTAKPQGSGGRGLAWPGPRFGTAASHFGDGVGPGGRSPQDLEKLPAHAWCRQRPVLGRELQRRGAELSLW